MNSCNPVNFPSDPKSKSFLFSLFITLSLVCGVYFIGSELMQNDISMLTGFGWNTTGQHAEATKCENLPLKVSALDMQINVTRESNRTHWQKCNEKCRPKGSEALPGGIVSAVSNFEMHPLWGSLSEDKNSKQASGLLAIAVGISQKNLVNEIVEKFLENNFVVMLFHYDGVVDEWQNFEWRDRVIHVAARNQTKWWFAKRFLHPDIIAEYDYVFLWDEDLGVESFCPQKYLSIIKEEGLEISQPALDPSKSAVYQPITARRQGTKVHRRYFKYKGSGRCDENSTAPPCVGWVELMAPVFSRAAWRCAWYMIQNDLIHAWGLDLQLGYCAQGDRMAKVGVVDEEYIVHLGLPTLGGFSDRHKRNAELFEKSSDSQNSLQSEALTADMYRINHRSAVRRRSYDEMMVYRQRWKKAIEEDECWIDPYKETPNNE